jgi:hypothetical protein
MWRSAIVAAMTVLVACSGRGTAPDPADPPLAAGDRASGTDEIVAAASTRCVIDRVERSGDELPLVIDGNAPTPVLEIAYLATIAEHPDRASLRFHAAAALAERGALEAARVQLDRGKELDATARSGIPQAILLGERVADDETDLHVVPFLVLAGQRDRAARVFDANLPIDERADISVVVGRALAALGRLDDLRAMIARAGAEHAVELAVGWLEASVQLDLPLEDPVAAVIAARRADRIDDEDLVLWMITKHGVRGHGPALAPLREALRDIRSERRPALILSLYQVALIDGADDAELEALVAELAASPGLIVDQVPILLALARGTLDQALDAIETFRTAYPTHPEVASFLIGLLWARHVADGFDPAFDARLTAAACATPPA